ncbi:MAG: zinc ribbon domain-containing protein [Oscillospiraceae bacterium]|nr:zinc ribbon domain-containing protein [Oscillospiraceae bacterium]
MKKLTATLLCIVLLIGMAAGIASAENKYCPFCGHEYSVEKGFAFCPNCGKELPQNEPAHKSAEKSLESNSKIAVGDLVRFGRYEQDNNPSNGAEGIEWIVLDVQGEKALLLSRYGLDCKRYYKDQTPVTWETSDLRVWLNGEFSDTAFNQDEMGRILLSRVPADKNPEYNTDAGNETEDRVFLLSALEAEQYLAEETAKCQATAYALAKGASSGKNGNSWWFLRTPGSEQKMVMIIKTDGTMNLGGAVPDGKGANGVNRPSLWLDLRNWDTYEQPPVGVESVPASASTIAEGSNSNSEGKSAGTSPYLIGTSENTFAGLYARMCINLDLKANPIPAPEEEVDTYGTNDKVYATVLKDDSTSYEYIGYVRGPAGDNKYIIWYWTGLHEDGSIISQTVYYMLDGKYLGNIQRDRTAGTSTSSSRCPYYVPSEPINKK